MVEKRKLIAVVRDRKDLATLSDEEIVDVLEAATSVVAAVQRTRVQLALDELKSEKYSNNFADALYIAFGKEWFDWFKVVLTHLDKDESRAD
jgi:hypothetical protein